MTQAGFDLTEISASVWQELIDRHYLTCELTDDGWEWYRYSTIEGEKDLIITANNPITGLYHNGGRETEIGYASYIGIEGTNDFVVDVFNFIREHAEYTKSEQFGCRNYI